jgi:hypothetical protein
MDECVRLAVITRNEAEALHRVEELDRAGGLFPGKLALGSRVAFLDRNNVADDLQVARRNLSATIHEREFELLTFGKPFEARAFDSADVDEYVLAAVFPLDEAEALAGIEELDSSLALANDLGRHSAAGTTAAAAAEAAATTTAAAAAEAAAATAAAASKAAAATAAAAAEPVTAAKTISATEPIAAAHEGVEALFSEAVSLVASPSATPSIKTHTAE